MKTVADTIAEALSEKGVDTVFTLIGTANFPYTSALESKGATVFRARHENGAVSMATAWSRVTGRVGICTLSKGAGLTHGLTALVEARKSHTALLVLAADTPASAVYSSPAVPQSAVVEAVLVANDRIHSPQSARADIDRAYRLAERTRQPVVLMVSSDIVKQPAAEEHEPLVAAPLPAAPDPAAQAIAAAVDLIANSERPAILAGGGVLNADAVDDVATLGRRMGAMLSTSILAHGMFAGDPAALGLSGGYAKPGTVAAMAEADVVVVLGASLNDWTTRAGSLFPDARVIQIDTDTGAFGRHYPVDLAILADAGAAARALTAELDRREVPAANASVRSSPTPPKSDATALVDGVERIRAGALTKALDALLPPDRTVAIDGGGCLEASVGLEPGHARGMLFPITYMSIGLGLSTGLGAAIGDPERFTVIALGDASALSAFADIETVSRLGLPVLIVIYNDAAHGGELGIFKNSGRDAGLLQFPDFDFAGVARAAGIQAATVRNLDDLAAIGTWLEQRDGPLLIDAKITLHESEEEMFSGSDGWKTRLVKSQGL